MATLHIKHNVNLLATYVKLRVPVSKFGLVNTPLITVYNSVTVTKQTKLHIKTKKILRLLVNV